MSPASSFSINDKSIMALSQGGIRLNEEEKITGYRVIYLPKPQRVGHYQRYPRTYTQHSKLILTNKKETMIDSKAY